MKKIFCLILLPLVFIACNNAGTKTDCENCESFTGDFLYMADAAILKGDDFIYAVQLDEQAQELANKVAPIKKEAYDMVQVTVKGFLSQKPEGHEGWDEILSIKEITTIADKPSEADILIQQ